MRNVLVIALILLPLLAACGSGRDDRAVSPAAAPDTAAHAAVEQPAPPATRRQAQKAWDTADSNSFDVEEGIRSRREAIAPQSANLPLEYDTLRLTASDHPSVPENIARWLEERGYEIPQATDSRTGEYSNVLSGEFIEQGQQDLAVLASRDNMIELLVFENSTTDSIHSIKEKSAEHWIKYAAIDSVVLLAYKIQKVGKKYIMDHYAEYGGPEPPEITHDAINFYLVEKASTVYYFHSGVWKALQGAD